jgi:hypothetical protein
MFVAFFFEFECGGLKNLVAITKCTHRLMSATLSLSPFYFISKCNSENYIKPTEKWW